MDPDAKKSSGAALKINAMRVKFLNLEMTAGGAVGARQVLNIVLAE
ncbi:MAG: hypothetical protein V7740_13295 [Pseudomonas marincola]